MSFILSNYSGDKNEERLDHLNRRLDEIEAKLDRLIQSNKSLISYFSAINTIHNDYDVRDRNLKIRGYAKKSGHIPPSNFVPEPKGSYSDS